MCNAQIAHVEGCKEQYDSIYKPQPYCYSEGKAMTTAFFDVTFASGRCLPAAGCVQLPGLVETLP